MYDFLHSVLLLLVLLNPFLIVIYLVDIFKKVNQSEFRMVLVRAGIISSLVFCTFAILGDSIFRVGLKVNFASFQTFGGIIFLLIGVQFVFKGPEAIEILRGESKHIAGAIAMPILIGPGTISASVVMGKTVDIVQACAAIALAVAICLITIYWLKCMHDSIRPKNEQIVERYIEVAGRITALFVGTIAIEMIMTGIMAWVHVG
jgi:multiple antibiotic resistance protein